MASVDEPVEKISAAREAVSEILSGLAESLQNADELHREFHGLGTTDKSTQLAVVTRCLEEQQAHIAATIATVETAQAQAQALHDGRSGTSSTSARPSPPPIVKDAPAYYGSGSS